MGVFAAAATSAVEALSTVFGDETIYSAPPSDPATILAVWSRVDDAVSFGGLDTQVRAPGWRVDIAQQVVPTRPRVGTDTLSRGAVTYQIRDVREDVERTSWVLDVSEV